MLLNSSGVRALSVLSSAALAVANVQQPFASEGRDDGLLTPFGDLSLLSTSQYTTLGHPLFPDYNVRIKKSDFCDRSVRYGHLDSA